MAQNLPVYMEMVELIAGGTTPQQVMNYKPSADVQDRVSYLLELGNEGRLSDGERAELDYYVELEHIFRMAKVRAREILAGIG